MTVTRTRLPVLAHPRDEARQHRQRLAVLFLFAGQGGRWLTIAEIAAGARLPIPDAYRAVDALVDEQYLTRTMRENRDGSRSPTWTRLHRPPVEAGP